MQTARPGNHPFGLLLRERRVEAKLSQSALAKLAGIDRSTISNLEEGRTQAAPNTIRRLRALKELELSALDPLDGSSSSDPDTWIAPLYDPLRLAADCSAMLNGPGGVLEQTYAYIDGQGAVDWFAYSNADNYVANFRNKFPHAAVAEAVQRYLKCATLDLVALGVGDGKTETRLAQQLCEAVPNVDLTMYLLDISHPLLVTAYKHAVSTLKTPRIPVVPIHGNFNEVSRLWQLHTQPRGGDRRRLWLLLGNTVANLTHEPTFLSDLHACARPGDMLLMDFGLTWAPSTDLAQVRLADPVVTQPFPELPNRWLTGLVRRHCRGCRSVTMKIEVHNRCALAGSYELHCVAHVRLATGDDRRFVVWRVRRYDLELLRDSVQDMHWHPLLAERFGAHPGQGIMLLERR